MGKAFLNQLLSLLYHKSIDIFFSFFLVHQEMIYFINTRWVVVFWGFCRKSSSSSSDSSIIIDWFWFIDVCVCVSFSLIFIIRFFDCRWCCLKKKTNTWTKKKLKNWRNCLFLFFCNNNNHSGTKKNNYQWRDRIGQNNRMWCQKDVFIDDDCVEHQHQYI